jgi:hypothetical protein
MAMPKTTEEMIEGCRLFLKRRSDEQTPPEIDRETDKDSSTSKTVPDAR